MQKKIEAEAGARFTADCNIVQHKLETQALRQKQQDEQDERANTITSKHEEKKRYILNLKA